jgi:hypothetical protein
MTAPASPSDLRPLDSEAQRILRLSLSALGVLGTASLLGVAFSLYLVNHAPLLLVGLSPLGRHIVLATPLTDPVALTAVVVVRRLAFYLASFFLGRALGPRGIPWIEARAARFAAFVRWLERVFSRWSHAVVLVMAGPTVSALAGMAGMRPALFVGLATVSLTVRMWIIIGFAGVFSEDIEVALAWIDRYWIPGTVVMVLGVAAYRFFRRRPATLMED